jgi:hypothetical protein
MNNQDQHDEDLLKRFINPERIEKAPEGFTSRSLARIRIDAQSARVNKGIFLKYRIPLISAIITTGLIIAAIIIPANETDSVGATLWKFFQSLEFSLPRINNTLLQDLNLPGWIAYAIVGILLLGLVDRTLFGIFKKENNQ